jgi:L-threonylcarbamoyladenylate synthase
MPCDVTVRGVRIRLMIVIISMLVSTARVFAAKQRPSDNPLIVHVADASGFARVARTVPPLVAALVARLSPGPISYILPHR